MLARRFVIANVTKGHNIGFTIPRPHLRPRVANHALRTPHQTRSFSLETITHPVKTLSIGILDLGGYMSTLPLPEFLPPYSATIILLTLLLRTGITLPITLWSRNRARRMREIALPQLKEMEKNLVVGFRADVNRKALSHEQKLQLYEDFKKEKGPELVATRSALYKKLKCSPLPTLITPPLVHIPFFVLFTLGLRECTLPPTPFSYEEFFSTTCLAKADPTGTFPVLIGVTTLANLEISKRFFKRSGVAKTEPTRWEKILENGLSMASVGMIVIAAQSPGAVTLYWMTSALYTMGQHVVLGIVDSRRRAITALPAADLTASKAEAPTAQRIIWATKRSRS